MRKHTRPRTRTEPSARRVASVTARAPRTPRADGAPRPQDVAAPADEREDRCASPEARSAHRTPISFARSGTALSRGAGCRPTRLRRTATPRPAPRPCKAPRPICLRGRRRESCRLCSQPGPATHRRTLRLPVAVEFRRRSMHAVAVGGHRGTAPREQSAILPVAWSGGRCHHGLAGR